MFESFISVVVAVDDADSNAQVGAFLARCTAFLDTAFTDFELVIVDNRSRCDFARLGLPEQVRRHCHVLTLANRVSWDVGVFAGLERANGDYTVVFDLMLVDHLPVILDMYRAAQVGNDFVILREMTPALNMLTAPRYAFFWAVRRATDVPMHAADRREVMISRRAVNWALRHRARSRFLPEIYAATGYGKAVIDVSFPSAPRRSADERSNLAWGAITRMTSLPIKMAECAILMLLFATCLFTANALAVKFAGVDLLGRSRVSAPGWTYLVILISLGFLLTNVSIYAVLRVLKVVSEDVRDEPLYVVEQMRRL